MPIRSQKAMTKKMKIQKIKVRIQIMPPDNKKATIEKKLKNTYGLKNTEFRKL